MDKSVWRIPDDERPPERFWMEFGRFVMATMKNDGSDDYRRTLVEWSDLLQKRYQGHEITGRVILDYMDSQMRRWS